MINHLEKGTGTPVIFLHGVGGDAHSWDFQMDSLSNDFRVIAWDMPGYGKSPPLNPMTFEALRDAFINLMDNLGLDKANVVGHSMGGMVAQEAAAKFPERFHTLILSATSPAFGRADGDFQKEFVAARIEPLEKGLTMAELAENMAPNLMGAKPDLKGLELATKVMSTVSSETYCSAMRCLVTFDRRDALANYRMPILVLAGEVDENAPAPMMEKMASKIPGAEYICIPGVGHLANMEQPVTFNNVIAEFLLKHGAF
jgi:3-oxoadipate enol-lactonase